MAERAIFTSSAVVLCEEGDFPIIPADVLDASEAVGYKSTHTANQAVDLLFNLTGDEVQEMKLAAAGISFVGIGDSEARAVSGSSLYRSTLSLSIGRAVPYPRAIDLLLYTVSAQMARLGISYKDLV